MFWAVYLAGVLSGLALSWGLRELVSGPTVRQRIREQPCAGCGFMFSVRDLAWSGGLAWCADCGATPLSRGRR